MRAEVKDILDYTRYLVKEDENRIPMINLIIYYAQYLSIEERWVPLLWSNFFNINGIPYLAPVLAESVDYSYPKDYAIEENCVANFSSKIYIDKAILHITDILKQLGFEGVQQFVTGVCDIQGRPSIDPYHMLYYALKSKDKIDRIKAKQTMLNDENSKKYVKQVKDDFGDEITIECTKYVA